MSISDRLDDIQRRSDDATEGPWWGLMIFGKCEVFANTGSGSDPMLAAGLLPDNAEFVVNARTDVPWLIEQVRKRDAALRAVLDRHKPHPYEGMGWREDHTYGYVGTVCNACGTPDEYGVPWPCPTVLAIEKAVR